MDGPARVPTPEIVPARLPGADTDELSYCTISSDGGLGVTVWSLPSLRSATGLEVQLEISPEHPVIIGRKNGGEIEYLDPLYTPTPIMPGTGKTILRHAGAAEDEYVSRGHFMLRGHPQGIVLINGVPRRGGGIRPPRNWTQLLQPGYRMLRPSEELLIERGASVSIRLPNETRLTITAQ